MKLHWARAALCALLPPLAAAGPARQKPLVDPTFELSVPAGWRAVRGAEGLRVQGAAGPSGLRPWIFVRHVDAGDATFSDADAYVLRQTKTTAKIPGWSCGPVTGIALGARRARRFVKEASEFIPPSSMETREIPTREEHLVLPASSGFYVLVLRSARTDFARNSSAFRRLLKSFKPKL